MGPTDFELQSVRTVTNNDLDDDSQRPRQSAGLAKDPQVLRYRTRSILVFIFYLLILLIPWFLTCASMIRPLNRYSYIDQSGSVTPTEAKGWNRMRVALGTLTSIAGVIGLPIVSYLLAHGAVVYTQRRSAGQKLSVLQLFMLADRQWLNPAFLLKGRNNLKRQMVPIYLWLAAGLILITAVQPPIQAILVQDEKINIVTCKGHPSMHRNNDVKGCQLPFSDNNTQVVAYDSEPINLNFSPQNLIVKKTSQRLISATGHDIQPHLWSDSPSFSRENYHMDTSRTLSWYYQKSADDTGRKRLYFASPVANGTSTGVYRHHAARMDSIAKCYQEESFPKQCEGKKPFKTSLSADWLNIDICVEGSFDTVPWNTSRDKQEHSERMWLALRWDVPKDDEYYPFAKDKNWVLRCESVSRRGWFELPNSVNPMPGPLLDEWPSLRKLELEYNDYYPEGSSREARYPAAEISDEDLESYRDEASDFVADFFNTETFRTPGPLMTTALAMFGNTSFFYAASMADKESSNQTINSICEQASLPLTGLGLQNSQHQWCNRAGLRSYETAPSMEGFMASYFEGFRDGNRTENMLEMGMFFANEALLTTAASERDARRIYFNPGTTITKPKRDMAAIICVSVLIGLQTIGLCVLMWYILHAPTWTDTLDADALAQIGGQLKEWGEQRPDPTELSGVVGIDSARHDADASSVRLSTAHDTSVHSRPIHLSLGGEGLITRSAMKRMRTDSTVVYS